MSSLSGNYIDMKARLRPVRSTAESSGVAVRTHNTQWPTFYSHQNLLHFNKCLILQCGTQLMTCTRLCTMTAKHLIYFIFITAWYYVPNICQLRPSNVPLDIRQNCRNSLASQQLYLVILTFANQGKHATKKFLGISKSGYFKDSMICSTISCTFAIEVSFFNMVLHR